MVTDITELSFDEIAEGAEVSRDYVISPSVYDGFLAAFGDRSPIHVDDDYARARGFDEKVMHGAILNGFVSELIGVQFPGRRALLLSVDLRYANPSYLGDELRIEATVAQKIESQHVIVLKLRIQNLTQNSLAASGRAQVRVAEE